jgi:hypothetical protein
MVLILSRKPGEAIVLGIASAPTTARPGTTAPIPDRDGPSDGGGEGAAPCGALAADWSPSAERRGRADPGKTGPWAIIPTSTDP